MANPNLILKIAVVCGSVLLGGSFVAYRSGVFKGRPGQNNATAIDSPEVKIVKLDSFFIDEHMSSSKSAGEVFYPKDLKISPTQTDTSKKKKTGVTNKKNQAGNNANASQSTSKAKKDTNKVKQVQIMPSSKSAPIFDRKK